MAQIPYIDENAVPRERKERIGMTMVWVEPAFTTQAENLNLKPGVSPGRCRSVGWHGPRHGEATGWIVNYADRMYSGTQRTLKGLPGALSQKAGPGVADGPKRTTVLLSSVEHCSL